LSIFTATAAPINTPATPAHAASAVTGGVAGQQLLFADLIADHAANRRATDSADCAAARQHGAAYGTDPGADGGTLVTVRHPGATAQAEQHCDGQRTDCKSFCGFHAYASLKLS